MGRSAARLQRRARGSWCPRLHRISTESVRHARPRLSDARPHHMGWDTAERRPPRRVSLAW
jgi:hypothetical protein